MTLAIKLLPFLLLAAFVWWMVTSGQRATRGLFRNSKPLSDWQILEIVQSFAKTLDVDKFEVRVLDMDQVNGLALPGGEIFISRGLYEKFLNGEIGREEIGGVIAHEIGHVALGHHQRRLGAWRTETAALAVLWFFRILMGWFFLLALLGLNLLRNQMSQRDEFESDAFAVQLMARAGYDPAASVRLLEKLKEWHGSDGPRGALRWLSTHPPIDARIEAIQKEIAARAADNGEPSPGSTPEATV